MEFDNVGSHCAAEGCNQRDFLPFTCDGCNKPFCLAHRSGLAHNCAGSERKDVTSIDCPICGKSIRMAKSDNPDHAWETHFATECSQVAAKPAQTRICKAPGCKTVLGPSNTFVCSSCGLAVCLPHRVAEAHNCARGARNQRAAAALARAGATTSTTRSQPKITSYTTASSSSSSGRRKAVPEDPSNTLRGTAERRMQRHQQGQSAGGSEVLPCPQCDQVFNDPVALVNHSESVHGAMGAGDRCPHCRAVFRDPVQLVEHVQNAHTQSDSGCLVM